MHHCVFIFVERICVLYAKEHRCASTNVCVIYARSAAGAPYVLMVVFEQHVLHVRVGPFVRTINNGLHAKIAMEVHIAFTNVLNIIARYAIHILYVSIIEHEQNVKIAIQQYYAPMISEKLDVKYAKGRLCVFTIEKKVFVKIAMGL